MVVCVRVWVFLLAAVLLTGCATTNVRALRAYAYEDANAVVAVDRTDDIATVLGYLDTLLRETPYSPGDAWVAAMALDNAEAERLKAQVSESAPYDGDEFTIPVVKLYRLHLASVIEQAKQAHEDGEAEYPSLLAAVDELAGGKKLAERWEALEKAGDEVAEAERALAVVEAKYRGHTIDWARPPEDLRAANERVKAAERAQELAQKEVLAAVGALQSATADHGVRKRIARDATIALSVALRVDLESLALVPFVIANLVRSIPSAPQQLLEDFQRRPSLQVVQQIVELPALAVAIKGRLEQQLDVVEALMDGLTTMTATELAATAGFRLEESAVDQIVGIALDSFHAELNVDAEVLFYTQLVGESDEEVVRNDDGTSHRTSLRGRTRRIAYDVSPIWLIGVQLAAGLDAIKLPEAANLKLGFTTDRVFSGGGTVAEGSLGEELGLSGVASDILDIGLGFLGVKSNVKLATFAVGTYDLIAVDPGSGEDLGIVRGKEAVPFELGYKQIDVGYDVSWLFYEKARSYYIEETTLGYRWVDYALPRMVYELRNLEPDGSKNTNYVFLREHPEEQFIYSQLHMGGVRLRMGPGGAPLIHPYLDIAAYLDGGPVAFELADEDVVGFAFGASVVGALGLRVRLTPRKFPLLAHAGVHYEMNMMHTSASDQDSGNRIDFGSTDMFHGVQAQLRGAL